MKWLFERANSGTRLPPEEVVMANDEVRRIDLNSARIAYRVAGSGPPLVLVHGYPMHGETWRKLVPELARHFTCYLPDLPGLGLSDWRADTDFSFPGHARTLRAFVDALRLDGYALVAQ